MRLSTDKYTSRSQEYLILDASYMLACVALIEMNKLGLILEMFYRLAIKSSILLKDIYNDWRSWNTASDKLLRCNQTIG